MKLKTYLNLLVKNPKNVFKYFRKSELLSIDVIDNNRGFHKDLLFSIPELIGDQEFDTYYFYFAAKPVETICDIENAVAKLIQFWVDKVLEIGNGEIIFLPIDFSDEYIGCLRVFNEEEQLVLTYGFSRRPGPTVDPLNPEDYYKEITDFEASPERQMKVNKSVLISTLNKQILKLRRMTI